MLGNRMSKLGTQQVAWGASGYVRPAEWIAMPTLTAGEEKLVGLYRVNDAANQCVAFTVTGNYTVDWGDGSAPENVASGVKAEHTYTFADIDPATETTGGWRQAIITITPQAGAALTTINLTSVHSVGKGNYTSWWLDVAVVGAGVTTLWCGGHSSELKHLANMEQFEYVGTNTIQTFGIPASTSLFGNCTNLQNVVAIDTSNGLTFYDAFRLCTSLTTIPAIDTSSGKNFGSMFTDCSSLSSIPALDTSSGTNFSGMFFGCSSLQSIPALDTSSGGNFSGMFWSCTSLQSIPALDTSSGGNFSDMFRGCSSLTTIPALDTSSGTSFTNMFAGCSSLSSIPALDTSSGTNFSDMFRGCSSLQTIPALDTSSGTSFTRMFDGCSSLSSIPALDTSSGTSFTYMFTGCSSLSTIPALDTSSGGNFFNMFAGTGRIASSGMTGPKYSHSYANNLLIQSEIVTIFTNLGIAPIGTGQTITVTGNPGAAGLTGPEIAIATAKNWTVVN